jgi:hypothetical protein
MTIEGKVKRKREGVGVRGWVRKDDKKEGKMMIVEEKGNRNWKEKMMMGQGRRKGKREGKGKGIGIGKGMGKRK